MAYDEGLAQRVREALEEYPDLVEKKMFGGIAFILRGNMACGVRESELMVRVGSEDHQAALQKPHVRDFDLSGRPMKGWVLVTPEATDDDQMLTDWVAQGARFALTLPPK